MMAAGITGGIAFLFYRSVWGFVLFPLVYVMLRGRRIDELKGLRREALQEHYMQGIQILNGCLQAGMSMESAWKEVERECGILYGKEDDFYREIKTINLSVTYNQSIEQLFLEFAHRAGIEDMISFAEILGYGKRSGGNWKRIIERTVSHMAERYEAEMQIQVMVAGKRLEQQVMSVVPLGMIFFLQISSWEYIKVLYGTVFGVVSMSICLVFYVLAIYLSEKIMDIQV
jgi:tight adherence protein B